MNTRSIDNHQGNQSRAPSENSSQTEPPDWLQLMLILVGAFYIVFGLIGRFLWLEITRGGNIGTSDYVVANLCWIIPVVSLAVAIALAIAHRYRFSALVASLLPILLYLLFIIIAFVFRI